MMLCCTAKRARSATSMAMLVVSEPERGPSSVVGVPKPPMKPTA
jgi:hypothetical protein